MISRLEYRWQVLFVVMIGTFMAALDSSIVNISIPAMMHSFHSPVDEVEWVITSYMIAFAVFMPLTAWVKEHIGQKRLYIFSLLLFTVGSLLCGISNSLGFLIFSRVLQAVGGGALTPSAMAMVSKVFKPEERGKALGLWGLGVVIGPAIGPTLGGILTAAFGWRSIFLVNIPIGIIGVYYSIKIIRELDEKLSPAKFDWTGFITFTSFLILLLFGVSRFESPESDWRWIMALIAISLVFLYLFIRWELRQKNPLLDLKLFKIIPYTSAVVITASRSGALYGGIFLLPILLQSILNYSETISGLFLLPGSLIVALMMPFAGKWADGNGPRGISMLGLFVVSMSMVLFAFIDLESSKEFILSATMVRGVGLGFLVTPIATAAVNSVPYNRITMSSSILNLSQQVGGAIGVAALATFYQARFHHHATLDMNVAGSLLPQLKAVQESFAMAGVVMFLTLLPALWLPKKVAPKKESGEIILEV
jgi:DHA2 family multidrug resistance protein